jgi:3-oxoacyl-[acyl-carrier-protein] synthase II
MTERRAVVTSFGLVTPLGNMKEDVWNKLTSKHSASKNWEDLEKEGFRFSKACRVEENSGIPQFERGAWLTIKALQNAMSGTSLVFPENTGIFIGSTIGESGAFEAIASGKKLDPQKYTIDSFANIIKKKLGINGISYSYGTACAAGNYALGAAANAIRSGLTEVAIAGGVEPFSKVAMTGFSRSRAMTSDQCRPFDSNRDGMILGEGAAIFIMEEEKHALNRHVEPLAIVGQLGLSCDAYHPTAPLMNGSGVACAMKNVLTLEKIVSTDINWICAHGSGTVVSDRAEAIAIRNVFGSNVPVSGVKGAFGHSLGAATAIQAALCIIALEKNEIPPTVNLEKPDPEFEIDLVCSLRTKNLNYILNCGYAFGGLNSALILKRWK